MQIKQNYKFNILYNKGITFLPYPYRNSIHLAQALAALFRAGFVLASSGRDTRRTLMHLHTPCTHTRTPTSLWHLKKLSVGRKEA